MSLGDPYGGVFATEFLSTLNEMLLKDQEAIIKEIKPEKDLDYRYEGEFYPEPEEMGHPPNLKTVVFTCGTKKSRYFYRSGR